MKNAPYYIQKYTIETFWPMEKISLQMIKTRTPKCDTKGEKSRFSVNCALNGMYTSAKTFKSINKIVGVL